jgi:hypothetical protein
MKPRETAIVIIIAVLIMLAVYWLAYGGGV